jgi:hypothetical protein
MDRADTQIEHYKNLFFAYGDNKIKILFTFIIHQNRWVNANEVAAYTGVKFSHIHRYLNIFLNDKVIIEMIHPGGKIFKLNPEIS